MARKLFGIVTDFVPAGFLLDKFVKPITHARVVVDTVRIDRKRIRATERFAERRTALTAERPVIFVWWLCTKDLHEMFAAHQCELVPFNKNEGGYAELPAAAAMASAHDRRVTGNRERHPAAATGAMDHLNSPSFNR